MPCHGRKGPAGGDARVGPLLADRLAQQPAVIRLAARFEGAVATAGSPHQPVCRAVLFASGRVEDQVHDFAELADTRVPVKEADRARAGRWSCTMRRNVTFDQLGQLVL
jgi:hypothetical protein